MFVAVLGAGIAVNGLDVAECFVLNGPPSRCNESGSVVPLLDVT